MITPSMDSKDFHAHQRLVSEWFASIDVDQAASSLGVDARLLRRWGGNVSRSLPPGLSLVLKVKLGAGPSPPSVLGFRLVRRDPLNPFGVFDSQCEVPLAVPVVLLKTPSDQRAASYWIHLFYRDQRKADAVIGDLDEQFCQRVKRYGKRRAVRWYRAQVAWSLLSLLRPLLPRILGIVAARELWRRILR